ncbi:hypothetical protein YW7DRAFT_01251 [Streptomyces sp. AmelKG-E11A]|nr:hypothetical protein YW7DRAFT_01251 [Streptomyces sp. AmelKG-E11A]
MWAGRGVRGGLGARGRWVAGASGRLAAGLASAAGSAGSAGSVPCAVPCRWSMSGHAGRASLWVGTRGVGSAVGAVARRLGARALLPWGVRGSLNAGGYAVGRLLDGCLQAVAFSGVGLVALVALVALIGLIGLSGRRAYVGGGLSSSCRSLVLLVVLLVLCGVVVLRLLCRRVVRVLPFLLFLLFLWGRYCRPLVLSVACGSLLGARSCGAAVACRRGR